MKDRLTTYKQFLHITRKTKRRIENDTQKIRKDIMEDLRQMFTLAKQMATAPDCKPRQKEHWIRVMGYIGQVINSLSKSFEEAKALEHLEHLEKMINEAGDSEQNQTA